MMCKDFTFILFLFAALALCKKKDPFEKSKVQKLTSTVAIAMKSVEEDMNYIIYYHTTQRRCQDCARINKVMIEFAKKWRGVINVFELDCGILEKEDGSARGSVLKCDRKEDSKLPAIDFYNPPISKWDRAKQNMALADLKEYKGPADVDFLEEFMFKSLSNYGKTFMTSSQLNEYFREDYVGAKALVFLSEEGVTPQMKALTAYFVDRIDFAFIHEELDEVFEKYGVEDTPDLHILVKDTDTGNWKKSIGYEGKWEYLRLRKFCEKYALKEKSVKPEHSFFDKERMDIQEENRMEDKKERDKRRKARIDSKKWLFEFDGDNFENELIKYKEDIVLVHSSSQKSGKHKKWEVVKRKLKGLVRFYEMNPLLKENKKLVKNEFVGLKSPFIALYPQGNLVKKKKGRKIYSSEAPFSKIAGFVAEHTKDPTDSLSIESMRIMITNSVYSYQAACILFHNNPSTLLSYRKVASNPEYKDFMNFGTFKNPPKDIREQIPSKRFPSVVIFFSNFNEEFEVDIQKYPIRMSTYEGSILTEKLNKFIENFVSTKIKPKKGKGDAEMKEMTEPAHWESCMDNVLCLIAFINSDGEDKERRDDLDKKGLKTAPPDQVDNSSKSPLRRIKHKYSEPGMNINVWYIDSECHPDLLPEFGIKRDEVPKLIAIWHYKRQYAQMLGVYNYDNIDHFMKRARRNAITKKDYPKGFKFHSRSCAQYKQQVLEWQVRDAKKVLNETKLETEEDLMKEVMEETKKREKRGKGKKKKNTYWSD